jgi:hypothetical protein
MPERHNSDDDRPKKSWRDIDKMRDGSRHISRKDQVAQERLEKSPVYDQYKNQVDKLLSGESLPEMLRDKLDPSGQLKVRDDLLKKIRGTEDRKKWSELVTDFAAKHDLPEDGYLLASWLDHPKDSVVEKALGKLEQMAGAGVLVGSKLPKSLEQRLRSLELTGLDPDVQARAKALREKLRS